MRLPDTRIQPLCFAWGIREHKCIYILLSKCTPTHTHTLARAIWINTILCHVSLRVTLIFPSPSTIAMILVLVLLLHRGSNILHLIVPSVSLISARPPPSPPHSSVPPSHLLSALGLQHCIISPFTCAASFAWAHLTPLPYTHHGNITFKYK